MDAKTRAIFRKAMREIGAKGGKIGGKRSLETMTPEERTARAKKASEAAANKRRAENLVLGLREEYDFPNTNGPPLTTYQAG